ncbi:MAG: hypothetical protein H6667_01045 [Ardenticatenaceae bacterium]|nr:hypothetical protein [Ardenticatenaceae bacterium]
MNFQLSPWDLGGLFNYSKAGGQINQPDGRPWQYSPQNKGVVAANGRNPSTNIRTASCLSPAVSL